jgi:hypothetical protein
MDKNLINRAKTGDFIVIVPSFQNWYALQDDRDELKKSGFSVAMLDRLGNTFHIITEKEMNKLGWYKNE